MKQGRGRSRWTKHRIQCDGLEVESENFQVKGDRGRLIVSKHGFGGHARLPASCVALANHNFLGHLEAFFAKCGK